MPFKRAGRQIAVECGAARLTATDESAKNRAAMGRTVRQDTVDIASDEHVGQHRLMEATLGEKKEIGEDLFRFRVIAWPSFAVVVVVTELRRWRIIEALTRNAGSEIAPGQAS